MTSETAPVRSPGNACGESANARRESPIGTRAKAGAALGGCRKGAWHTAASKRAADSISNCASIMASAWASVFVAASPGRCT
jgi:hypothetical protein